LDAKKIRARCAAASYALNSPTLTLERQAPKSRETSPPRATLFKWTRRTRDTRRPKEPSKGERDAILRSPETLRRLRVEVLPLTLSSTFCHQRCVRDGMEARSRACTRPHRRPRHSFRLPPREGQRLSEHLGCFSPLEPNGRRDRSLGHPTGPPRYATVIPVLQRGESAPFLPTGLARS